MSHVIATFCSCIGPHHPDCPLLLRLTIKERVCRARGVISYVPEDVANEIDALIECELERRARRRE